MDGFNICAVTPLPYKRKKNRKQRFLPEAIKTREKNREILNSSLNNLVFTEDDTDVLMLQ
jgi:hypothetical protein